MSGLTSQPCVLQGKLSHGVLLIGQMHQQGILKTDDLITRFFRLCTEMCVEISYRAQAEQQHNPAANPTMIRAKCYHNLDAFVRLIALLVKHSGEATNTVTKINLLNKVRPCSPSGGVDLVFVTVCILVGGIDSLCFYVPGFQLCSVSVLAPRVVSGFQLCSASTDHLCCASGSQ